MIGSSTILRAIVVSLLAISIVAASAPTSSGQGVFVVAPDSRPFGQSYGDWSAHWWQWVMSLEPEVNPQLDNSGSRCGNGQSGPVWFLAGNYGGSTTRTCTVPANTALFYPVVNALCWKPDDGETEEELRACGAGLIDLATALASEVDGAPVAGLENYRVRSPMFSFTLPGTDDRNISNLGPPLEREGVADGVWVLLSPLPVGPHVVHIHAEVPEIEIIIDVTYNLTVR